MTDVEKLTKQMEFIIEIDKMKSIYRRTKIADKSRLENDAEHSYHLAMMALLLIEHANDSNIDPIKVLKMVLIHDLVEIDAGDTYAYDAAGHQDKFERENAAAQRLFSILPDEQRNELNELWLEFEERQTVEAKFASALDSIQPLILNYLNGGEVWKENNITSEMVWNRNKKIGEVSEGLWLYAQHIIRKSIEQGILQA
jgi:putative hydrolase of HD superfamily